MSLAGTDWVQLTETLELTDALTARYVVDVSVVVEGSEASCIAVDDVEIARTH